MRKVHHRIEQLLVRSESTARRCDHFGKTRIAQHRCQHTAADDAGGADNHEVERLVH